MLWLICAGSQLMYYTSGRTVTAYKYFVYQLRPMHVNRPPGL